MLILLRSHCAGNCGKNVADRAFKTVESYLPTGCQARPWTIVSTKSSQTLAILTATSLTGGPIPRWGRVEMSREYTTPCELLPHSTVIEAAPDPKVDRSSGP